MPMNEIIEAKFRDWVKGESATGARVGIYERIRDIPYAVIPELGSPERYWQILMVKKGSCTPKHFLLRDMYERLGMLVMYAVYPFRWIELEVDYPPSLRKLAEALPLSYHLACRVDIEGALVLVDATLDPSLAKLGLPVNKTWDGVSDTLLPLRPCGEEQLYHPAEAYGMQPPQDERALAFYRGLNSWLDEVRKLPESI